MSNIYFYHFKDIVKPFCVVASDIGIADKIIANNLTDKKHSVNASMTTFGYKIEFIDLSKQKTIWLKSSNLVGKTSYPHHFESTPICRGAVKTTYQCDSSEVLDKCLKTHSKPFDIIAVYTGNKFLGSKRTIKEINEFLVNIVLTGIQNK